MRESFAVAIGILAFFEYTNGRRLRFYALALIALFFHLSAIILFLFPHVRFIVGIRTLIVSIFIGFCSFILGDFLMSRFTDYFIGMNIEDKIMVYSSQSASFFGFLGSCIHYLFVPIISYLLVYKRKNCKKNMLIARLMPFAVVIGIISCGFEGFTRWNNYWRIFYIVIIGELIWTLFESNKSLISKIVSVLILFYVLNVEGTHYLHRFSSGYHSYDFYYPYSTIFDDEDYSYREYVHDTALQDAKYNIYKRKK